MRPEVGSPGAGGAARTAQLRRYDVAAASPCNMSAVRSRIFRHACDLGPRDAAGNAWGFALRPDAAALRSSSLRWRTDLLMAAAFRQW